MDFYVLVLIVVLICSQYFVFILLFIFLCVQQKSCVISKSPSAWLYTEIVDFACQRSFWSGLHGNYILQLAHFEIL